MPDNAVETESLMRTWTDAHGNPIQCIHRYNRNIFGFSHPKNGE
jgi:hypothetical protein